MAPKKAPDVNSWRTQIEEAKLDDGNWTVKVIVIESAGSDQDRIYLSKFETYAAEEKRFVIKNICKTETIFMVNQLGGEKKVKDNNLRVFEEGQAYLKDKKDIPPDIQALIIKHLILKMKEEYLFVRRQRLEVKVGMKRESATMIDGAEVRGTINVAPPEPVETPPPAKGKKGQKTADSNVSPEPVEGKKYSTMLRVRGEEWRDKVYVDDYPTDGPNLYVAVTGFMEPNLLRWLIQIGVPLTAIVQVRIDPATIRIPSTLLRPTKRGQSQTEIMADKSLKFWEELQQLRINKESADDFRNTAFIVFTPPYSANNNLSGTPEVVYDELCYLMYDIQDLTRQHLHYLDNMDIIKIQQDTPTNEERYYKYYDQLFKDIPLESVTLYSLLDTVLQTVSKMNDIDEKSSRTSLSTALTLNQASQSKDGELKKDTAENLVNGVFNRLCITETDKKKYRFTYGEEYEEHKDPIVINYGDFAKNTTFHLGNINLDNIVWHTLLGMPIHKLWLNQPKPTEEQDAKVNFHINVLLSCFNRADVETAELNRLIHILACRKLYNNRSSLKKFHLPPSTICEFKKAYLKRSVLAEPLQTHSALLQTSSTTSPSFPPMTKSESVPYVLNPEEEDPEVCRIKFLFECPDLSELVTASEIANEQRFDHMIDDYDFFDELSGVSAFQIMLDAFNTFNCVDYKYCEVTDCIVLMFYNSHDKDGIAREEWRCHLPTPLCLQDFFDFVLEEHYDWIQKEEEIYDEEMALQTQSENKESIDPTAAKSCVENTEIEMELLMEGSLKYQEVAKIEETISETTDAIATSSKKTTSSPTTTDGDSKSKKTKSTPISTPRKVRQSMINPSDLPQPEKPRKPFSGYDLGDRRVEVFGKDVIYFAKDGTRVSSFYTLIIPINLESILLSVIPGKGRNEFWFHRALGENIAPDIIDTCESFRITSKDGVLINIKKQIYTLPLPLALTSSTEKTRKDTRSVDKLNASPQEIFETRSFHKFFITWPNGLITESVYETNSSIISHIKQYYVTKLPHIDEDMRCISLNGEVIVFKTSGVIEVLRPDSSYIKITHCEKRLIQPKGADDLPSETSSEKSKKDKGLKKVKSSKTSSKSSKNVILEEDKTSEVKQDEYELVIDEFESIDANGLRQQWLSDTPIDIEKLLIRTATEFNLREVFSRRMDGTNILINKDGVQLVTFPDKTRIVTTYVTEDEEIFPEWTEEESQYFDMFESVTQETESKSKVSESQKSNNSASEFTARKVEEEEVKEYVRTDGYVSVQIVYDIEHPNFSTVSINKVNGKISVDSPNGTSVVVNPDNNYEMFLDESTSASFDGENLVINNEACTECQSNTTCRVKIKSDDKSSVSKLHQHWLKMKDSFNNIVVVNEEGNITLKNKNTDKRESDGSIVESLYEEEVAANAPKQEDAQLVDFKSEMSGRGKCSDIYNAKTLKFFVFRRDLGCSELVHRRLLDEYKQACRWLPWCSVNHYNTFGDNRGLVSILTPIHLTETEKWLVESKLANKPEYLAYKDLKEDTGKGFYHWMRPYERFEPKPMKPANVLPPRLPRAFVLRTLEQQWKEESRNKFKGARELVSAILRYRHRMDSESETILNVPIVDPRTEDERAIDDIVHALAHRTYEELKQRLEDDVQTRIKQDITTKPLPVSEELSVAEEADEVMDDGQVEEEQSLVGELEKADEMSPNLKAYWRCRAEELKEEEFYKNLLRDGSVPPYFRNVLGGAIWWEMNSVAGEAVTKAERKKMRCQCPIEEASSKAKTESTLPNFMPE